MHIKKNYINYRSDHWSEVDDEEKALAKYLEQYKDVYNVHNVDRFVRVLNDYGLAGCKVLDYGGGCGMLACRMAEAGHDVTLADQSTVALKAATLLADSKSLPIKTLRLERAEDLGTETFDVIVMKDLIEHVVDDAALVSSLFEALRTDGLMAFSSQNMHSLNYMVEGGLRKLRNPHKQWMGWDRTHLRFYTPDLMRNLATNAGLTFERFDSAYVLPYKLVLLLPLPTLLKLALYKFLFKVDRTITTYFFSRRGWNLMVVTRKRP